MHVQKTLEKLGYRPNEVKVYLASLQLGLCKVSDIAEKISLPRTSVQEILNSLKLYGLMDPVVRKNHRYWVAENPHKLLITLKENEVALSSVMPELQSLRSEIGAKPTVRTFSGANEIAKIMDDIYETKHHILAIVSWPDWVDLFGQEFVDDFIQRRYQRFLKIRLLAPRTSMAEALKRRDDRELRTTRFLPEDSVINNSNFIYGNKVATISLNKKLPVGIIIEDADIHHTMSVLFEALWQKSSSQ